MTDVFYTIKNCTLFEGFSELEILAVLSELGYSIKSYAAGQTIYHDDLDKPGSLGCVYLIVSGEISLALLRDTVLEHQLRILGAGSLFGIVLAFSGIPHIPYSYRAVTDTVLMRIPVSFFDASHNAGRSLHTRVLLNFLRITEDKAAFLYRKISCLKSLTVRERIVKYLSTLAQEESTYPGYTRSQLANYLGISREALSRGLSGMQKEGLIEVRKGEIRILDRNAFLLGGERVSCSHPAKIRRLPAAAVPAPSFLRTLPLFEHLPAAAVNRFLNLSHAKFIQVPAGEYLYWRGNTEKKLFIVLEGTCSLLFETNDAHPHLITQLGPGQLTGDTSYFSSRSRFDISCKAETPCRVMVIRGEDFSELFTGQYEEQETILNNLFTMMSRKISVLRDKVHLLSNPAARQRIVWYLYSLMEREGTPHLIPPLSRENMARYLGISRPALCKELRILENQNIIRVHRGTFEILDTERIEPLRI